MFTPFGIRISAAPTNNNFCRPKPRPVTERPLVSIVTPAYNGEAHLRACIESVLAQTYTNWDYTIVNNRSSDRTLEIAEEYAAMDPRIRVWTAPVHVPVEQSYNNAIRQVSPSAKYCKVVAADDCLFPECLARMVELAEANPRVAIVGSYALADSDVMWQGLPFTDSVVAGREICRRWLLGGSYVFGTASSELFRADIVRRRADFYNVMQLHCDSEACLEVLRDNDFGFVHQVLVHQGTRRDSLTSFSQRMNTYLPYWLYELIEYGPVYLSPNEVESRIRAMLRGYYSYLGEQAYRGRESEFWDYHREKLTALGYPMSVRRVALAATLHAVNKVNPRAVAQLALRPFRRMSARVGQFAASASTRARSKPPMPARSLDV